MKHFNRVIIFEGPDDTGKSNIAQELSNHIGIKYFKHTEEDNIFNIENREAIINNQNYIVNLLDTLKISLILDRFHVSEYVYSKAFKRDFDVERIYKVDEKLSKLNTTIIYCYKNNLDKYHDKLVDKSKVSKVKRLYDKFLNNSKCKVFKLNTDDEDIKSQIKKIKSYLKE